MDLKEPNIPDEAIGEIESMLLHPYKEFNSQEFINLYNEDDLGKSIPNLYMWLHTHFNDLQKYK
jgi:hypothetical protein